MSEMMAAALGYARNGWLVLPLHSSVDGDCTCGDPGCRSPGKHPRVAHGVHDATDDLETIRRWWKIWPDSNVGIASGPISDLVILDVDPRNGGDETLADLEREHGELDTVEAITGGSGRHLFFRWPTDDERIPFDLASGSNLLGPGLDVKADGGYCVAAPSRHASGRSYEWEVEHHPDDHDPAELPSWLLMRLRQTSQKRQKCPSGARSYARGSKVSKRTRDRLKRVLDALGVEYEDRPGEQRIRCPSPDHADTNPSCDLDLDRGVWICRSCGAGGGVRALEAMAGPIPIEPTEMEKLGDDPEERREVSDALTASGIQHNPNHLSDQHIACPVCGGEARLRLGCGVRWNCRTARCHRKWSGTGSGLLLALAGDRPKRKTDDLLPEELAAFDRKTCQHRSVILMANKRVRNRKSGVGVDCGGCPDCRRTRVIDTYIERGRGRIQQAGHVWSSDVPRKSWSRWRMAVKRLFDDPAIMRLAISPEGAFIGVVASEDPPEIEKETSASGKKRSGQRGKAALAFVQVTPQYEPSGVQLEQKLGKRLTDTEQIELVEASQKTDERLIAVAGWVSSCADYAGSSTRKKKERVLALPSNWKDEHGKPKSEWSPEGEGAEGIHAPRELIAALFIACQKYGVRCFREGTNKLICDTSNRLYTNAFVESGIKPFMQRSRKKKPEEPC